MDKIQAQRAVFQLRRKAVNSAPKAEPVNTSGDLVGWEKEAAERYPQGPTDPACADMLKSGDVRAIIKTAHQHWYGIGWPEDEIPIALLRRAMDLLSLQVEGSSACRACDGRGWIVTNDDTDNEVVQGTKQCPVCLGGNPEPLKDDTGCDV